MATPRICRFFFPTNPLLTMTILLCFFNYFLLLTYSDVSNVFCTEENQDVLDRVGRERSSEQVGKGYPHWNIRNENQYWLVEMAKYSAFYWETELERMLDLIPALELRTDAKESPDSDARIPAPRNDQSQWAQNISKGPTLPLVTERCSDESIANEIQKVNAKISNTFKQTNFGESSPLDALTENILRNGILGCKELKNLENRRDDPRIKYNFRSISQWRGKLEISATQSIPIKVRRFDRKQSPPKSSVEKMNYVMLARRNQVPYLDKSFEHVKYEVTSLLKMQGWYGVPRLIGLCLSSSNGQDIIEHHLSGKHGGERIISNTIRYLVSRHDEDTTPMCDSYYASFQCERLHSVMRIVNMSDRPALAALKIMMNTANIFYQLWSHGAVLYNLVGTSFVIDSNYDVMLTDVSTVKFLPQNNYSEHSHVQRLLSDTICTENHQCAAASWQSNSISYKFGLHCGEVRGFCAQDNRCWGIDSNVHACVLSRWFFVKLHSAIPTAWSRDEDLTNLLHCASKSAPDQRCNWKHLVIGLRELYKFAQQE